MYTERDEETIACRVCASAQWSVHARVASDSGPLVEPASYESGCRLQQPRRGRHATATASQPCICQQQQRRQQPSITSTIPHTAAAHQTTLHFSSQTELAILLLRRTVCPTSPSLLIHSDRTLYLLHLVTTASHHRPYCLPSSLLLCRPNRHPTPPVRPVPLVRPGQPRLRASWMSPLTLLCCRLLV